MPARHMTLRLLLILLVLSLVLSACGSATPPVVPTAPDQDETAQPVIYAPALAQDVRH